MVLGKLDRYVQKSETRPSSYTTHKNKLKIHGKLKCQTRNYKNHRRKQAAKCWTLLITILYLTYLPRQGKQKKKKKKIGLHQSKKFAQQRKLSTK